MKIGVISESTLMASGFGQQANMLCEDFKFRGHEVWHLGAHAMPRDNKPYKTVFLNYNDIKRLEQYQKELKFDWLIFFSPLPLWSNLTKSKLSLENFLFWFVYEGIQPNKGFIPVLDFIGDNLVHLTDFYNKQWKPLIDEHFVIPHGVDLSVFKKIDVDKKKWSRRLGVYFEDAIILNVDRNAPRKRWDFTFDALSRLKDVTLIAHTEHEPDEKTGKQDLQKLASQYGVLDRVVFTGFKFDKGLSPEELNELYNLADIRISTSGAEGFGLPTIESMAAGTFNVIPDNTTFREVSGGHAFLAECGSHSHCYGLLADVNIEHFVSGIRWAIEHPKERQAMEDLGRQYVKRYERNKVCDSFLELMREPDRQKRIEKFNLYLPRRKDSFEKAMKLGKVINPFVERGADFLNVTDGFDIFAMSLYKPVRGRANEKYKKIIYQSSLPFIKFCGICEFEIHGDCVFAGSLFEQISEEKTRQLLTRMDGVNWIFASFDTNPFSYNPERRLCMSQLRWDNLLKQFGFVRKQAVSLKLAKFSNVGAFCHE